MKLTVTVDNEGTATLTDKNFLASGGEAQVFVKDSTAYKLYHSPQKMLPLPKIEELQAIKASNVLTPQNIVRNNNNPIGYTMKYIKNTHPMCKLFTMNFRHDNKITQKDIDALVKEIQIGVNKIHEDGCLIVDLNEMNLLVSAQFDIPYFIDVDSYQTKSYKATALMESVRDRTIKNNRWTVYSDWYSFAIIATQLYIGIHPYRGSHPKYKSSQWLQRMEDGISIFDKHASVPRICNDFSVIPRKHRDWLEAVFVRNERSIPPFADSVTVFIPVPEIVVESTEDFVVEPYVTLNEKILSIFNFMGTNYVVGEKHLFKENIVLPSDAQGCKVLFCESNDMTPIVCKLKDELLIFEDIGTKQIGSIDASQMMYRNGAIYSVGNGKLIENSFDKIMGKIVHKMRVAANVLDLSTKVFDGVIFQDLLGKCYVTLPFEKGKCVSIPVKELNGYRILEARSERNICGVLGEKGGAYYRFVINFDGKFENYSITKADNVSYAPINLTVMNNGVCIMALEAEVHLFKDKQTKVVNSPPFGSDNKLLNFSGKVVFIDKNKVFSVKMQK